jgi:outer membrane receptor for ferrienterochelin and colicins
MKNIQRNSILLLSLMATLILLSFMPLWAEEKEPPKGEQVEAREMPEIEIPKMVVTGSREAVEAPEKLPVPVQIITKEEIEDIGAVNLGQVLEMVQGVELVTSPDQNISPGFKTLRIRGMDIEHCLVLVDGRRLPGAVPTTAGYSYTDISTINVDMIERIEVLRDGASAQYGSDAVAGVINIITKKYVQGFSANMQYGQSKEGDGIDRHSDASGGFPLGPLYVSMGAFVNNVDYYDRLISAENPYRWDSPNYDQSGMNGKIVLDISDQQFMALDLRYIESDSEFRKGKIAYRLTDKTELDSGLSWEGEFDRWRFYLGSYFATQDTKRRQTEDPDYKSDIDWDNLQNDANALWEATPWLSLFMGMTWREEKIDSEQRDFNETRRLKAVFAEAILRPFDRFKVQVSGRFEDYSDFGDNFAPKLAARYEILPSLAVRASVSKSFQVPTLFQLHDEFLGAMGWADIYGNPDLDPAEGMNITAGAVWKISEKHHTMATGDLFYNRIKNRIDSYFTGDYEIRNGDRYTEVTYENYKGTSTFKGAEVSFSTDLLYGFGLDIMGNILFAQGPLEPDGPDDKDLRNRPRSNAHVNLRYKHRDWFWGNFRYNYRGKYVTRYEKVSPFDTVNAQLNFAITDHIILYVGGRNLLDEDPPVDPARYETGHMQGMIDSTIGAFYYTGLRFRFL